MPGFLTLREAQFYGEVPMKRILLVSTFIVSSVLFGVERALIYVLPAVASVAMYILFAVAHKWDAHDKPPQSRH